MGAVFTSMPLAGRIFLGGWDFEGAGAIGCVCLIAGVYFHIVSRRFPAIPDYASILERAAEHSAAGRDRQAVILLTEAIRLDPQLWQAYQYRGELHLRHPDPQAALADFHEAIRLAPREAHLYTLRGWAHEALGNEAAAREDHERAATLAAQPTISIEP
ncbi:MAG: hypothetical protein ABI759_30415 [Candidatus Solibacter sp.]